MHDTIKSFYKPSARPFVDAALFLTAREEEMRFVVEEPDDPLEEDPTLRVTPTEMANQHDGEIRRLKLPLIWFLQTAWSPSGAEHLMRSARGYLTDELASESEEGGDLLTLEYISTVPELRGEEAAWKDAISRAANETKSLEELRKAIAGQINFYLRAHQARRSQSSHEVVQQ